MTYKDIKAHTKPEEREVEFYEAVDGSYIGKLYIGMYDVYSFSLSYRDFWAGRIPEDAQVIDEEHINFFQKLLDK